MLNYRITYTQWRHLDICCSPPIPTEKHRDRFAQISITTYQHLDETPCKSSLHTWIVYSHCIAQTFVTPCNIWITHRANYPRVEGTRSSKLVSTVQHQAMPCVRNIAPILHLYSTWQQLNLRCFCDLTQNKFSSQWSLASLQNTYNHP